MKTAIWRWILSPLTSVLAVRIRWEEPAPISFDEAWQHARVMLRPDEIEHWWQRPPRARSGGEDAQAGASGVGTPL